MAKELIYTANFANESPIYLETGVLVIWCRKNFGQEGRILPQLWLPKQMPHSLWVERGTWKAGSRSVWFADPFDAQVFKMRWLRDIAAAAAVENSLAVIGKVYRDALYGRYHLLWPRHGTDTAAMIRWCTEQWGPAHSQPRVVRLVRWIDAGDAIYVSDDADAFEFKMRWG